MDFRMDKASWVMVVFIIASCMYFIIGSALGTGLIDASGLLQAFGFALLATIAIIAISCIPVLIICYFIERIPDIDYAIWVATAFTVIGIISELIY